MTVAFILPVAFSKICFSGVTFRAKYEVFHKTIYQSQLSKPLEIRLFYRKLNRRKPGNSLGVIHRNSPKYCNDQKVNSTDTHPT